MACGYSAQFKLDTQNITSEISKKQIKYMSWLSRSDL